MWKPNRGEAEVSPYYQNEIIKNAALPYSLSKTISDYVSSRFLSSKIDVDALLNDLAKEIAEYIKYHIDDECIEHVNKTAREVLGFRLRELVRQKLEDEIRKNVDLIQTRYLGLIDEEFVKKVLSFSDLLDAQNEETKDEEDE